MYQSVPFRPSGISGFASEFLYFNLGHANLYFSAFGVTIIALDLTRRTSRSTKAYRNFSWMVVASEHHEEDVMALWGCPFSMSV